MNDFENNNQNGEPYDAYGYSTPIDPAPIEPEEMNDVHSRDVEQNQQMDTASNEVMQEESITEEPVTEESVTEEPVAEQMESESQPFGTGSTYAYSFRKAESQNDPNRQNDLNRQNDWNRLNNPNRQNVRPNNIPDMSDLQKYASRKTAKNSKKSSGGTFRKFGLCVCLAAVFGLVAGGVFLGVAKIGGDALGINSSNGIAESDVPKIESTAPANDSEQSTTDTASASATSSGELTVAQVAERCMPAMVAITTKSITEVPNYFGFGSQNYESTSSGSGIIVDQNDAELLIATNNHVVAGATTLTVSFVDDALVEATVKGTDAENDLAIVSVKLSDISADTLNAIKVIQIGDSDALAVGDQVVAIGNALGYGQSVSSGWISAMDREVVIDNITLSLIQTDAAINPGNSGGALLNMKGELIGINESKYADTSVEGMGYAIPVSTATPILSELMSKETRYKVDETNASYIGITCKDISADFASMYGVPTGVYVDSVEENGPAAQAGIQKGDIITKFDGTKLSSYTDLVGQLEYYAAGELVEVTFVRADNGEYKEQTAVVTLGSANSSDFLQQNNN